jgi:methyl-accepting chemotaxis protein WspA
VLLEAGQIETSMVQIQSSVRGFLLTGDEASPSRSAAKKTRCAITSNWSPPHGRQSGPANAPETADALVNNWLSNVVNPQVEKRRASARGQQRRCGGWHAPVAEARRMLKEVTDEEERLLAERSTTSGRLTGTMMLLLAGGAVCVVLALSLAACCRRRWRRRWCA